MNPFSLGQESNPWKTMKSEWQDSSPIVLICLVLFYITTFIVCFCVVSEWNNLTNFRKTFKSRSKTRHRDDIRYKRMMNKV